MWLRNPKSSPVMLGGIFVRRTMIPGYVRVQIRNRTSLNVAPSGNHVQ